MLVDEEFGAGVARAAKSAGVTLAMSVERSGQPEFDFEYGEAFGDHIEAFDPDYAKILVRYNPEGDTELNTRQAARLARLSGWLHERRRPFLFELLVPPTASQASQRGQDQLVYERQLLPRLTVAAIAELQRAGVEPDIWKIQGMDTRSADATAAAQARSGDRN